MQLLHATDPLKLIRGHFELAGSHRLAEALLELFLAQGIAATFRAWGIGTRPETSRWLELGCTLASAMMMLLAVNVLSHFATGRAYWWVPEPVNMQPADAAEAGAP